MSMAGREEDTDARIEALEVAGVAMFTTGDEERGGNVEES